MQLYTLKKSSFKIPDITKHISVDPEFFYLLSEQISNMQMYRVPRLAYNL